MYPWHAGRRASLTLGPSLQPRLRPGGFSESIPPRRPPFLRPRESEGVWRHHPRQESDLFIPPIQPAGKKPVFLRADSALHLRLGRRCLLACSGAGIRCLSYSRNIPRPRINSVSSGSQAGRRTCFEEEAKAGEGRRRRGRRETEGAKSGERATGIEGDDDGDARADGSEGGSHYMLLI